MPALSSRHAEGTYSWRVDTENPPPLAAPLICQFTTITHTRTGR